MTSSLLKPTNYENELQRVFSSPSALPGWVIPRGGSPSGAALLSVVVRDSRLAVAGAGKLGDALVFASADQRCLCQAGWLLSGADECVSP